MKGHILTYSLVVILGMSGCQILRTPHRAFEANSIPAKPDYSDTNHWSSLPWIKDYADSVPQGYGLNSNQEEAPMDVFYIHPTTFKSSDWNAPLMHVKTNEKTDAKVMLNQASVFNGKARVFAPRYRQMTYYGFFSKDTVSKQKAIGLAYKDVRAAFRHYLENWNDGRPIILAGHSQGALHGMQLLKDVFSDEEMKQKLVVAYLPGWPVSINKTGQISPCGKASDVHCFVSWNTYAYSKRSEKQGKDFYKNATCVNPISWNMEGDWSALPEHDGTLYGDFQEISDSLLEAKCDNGVLRIRTNQLPFPYKWVKNFHVADINLFWMDIRKDVSDRWEYYQETTQMQP